MRPDRVCAGNEYRWDLAGIEYVSLFGLEILHGSVDLVAIWRS